MTRTLLVRPISSTPPSVPISPPWPPNRLVPPRITAVIVCSSAPSPVTGTPTLQGHAAVDQADDRAHRQRGDDGDGDIFGLAVHENGRHQHRQLDDRADREVDAAADDDEGFADRQRAEKCAGPQNVEDVAL